MEHISYSKQTYSWGDLRILRKGNSYSCIIHPEHLAAINRQEAFTDEQNMRWQAKIADGVVNLKSGSHKFNIPLNQLNS
jgi:hypothetical protein